MRPCALATPLRRVSNTCATASTRGISSVLRALSRPCARRRSASTRPPPSSWNHGLRTNSSAIQFKDSNFQRPRTCPDRRGNSCAGCSNGTLRPAMCRSACSSLPVFSSRGSRACTRMSCATSSCSASMPRSVAPTPASNGSRHTARLPGCSAPLARRISASTRAADGPLPMSTCGAPVSIFSATELALSCSRTLVMPSLRRPSAWSR